MKTEAERFCVSAPWRLCEDAMVDKSETEEIDGLIVLPTTFQIGLDSHSSSFFIFACTYQYTYVHTHMHAYVRGLYQPTSPFRSRL